MLLSEAIGEFVSDVTKGKTNETPRTYFTKLCRLVDFFGDIDCCSFTQSSFTDFSSWFVGRGLSPFTVRSVFMNVRHFLKWLYGRDLVSASFVDAVPSVKLPRCLPKAISQADFEKMLAVADCRDKAFLMCLRDTGARVGGLCGARVSDLELDNKRLYVLEKGGRGRYVYLSQFTCDCLRDYVISRYPGDALFGLSRGGAYSMLRRLAVRCGVKRFNPHSFRHAFARDTIKNGCDLSRLSRLMGHSSVKVTADFIQCSRMLNYRRRTPFTVP